MEILFKWFFIEYFIINFFFMENSTGKKLGWMAVIYEPFVLWAINSSVEYSERLEIIVLSFFGMIALVQLFAKYANILLIKFLCSFGLGSELFLEEYFDDCWGQKWGGQMVNQMLFKKRGKVNLNHCEKLKRLNRVLRVEFCVLKWLNSHAIWYH